MENQHKLIVGYRDLTQPEIDLLNKVKSYAVGTGELCEAVSVHLAVQKREAAGKPDELARLRKAEAERWLSIARTDFQRAYMALSRAVAQPTTF